MFPIATPSWARASRILKTGDLHRKILLICALDQAIERRIPERPPPMAHDVGLARDALVFAFDPIILDWDFRRDEIGAYGAATQRQRQANRGAELRTSKGAARFNFR